MDKFYKIGYNTNMLNILVAPLSECEKGENYCKRIVAQLKQDKVEYSVYFSPSLTAIEENATQIMNQRGRTGLGYCWQRCCFTHLFKFG